MLGNDTLVRIMDLKYYGDSEKDLESIVSKFEEANCRFETFPRYDKGLERVLKIDEILKINKLNENLSERIRKLVKEHSDFRIDISST